MICDCFLFFNEVDLLNVRLHTLSPVVDRFVIAEATRTITGAPKELVFPKCADSLSRFSDRISYVVVDDLRSAEEVARDSYNLAFANENRQRNALVRGLNPAGSDEDIVLLSDLDEIPRPESVTEAAALLRTGVKSVRFLQTSYHFFLNFRNYTAPDWLLGTIAARRGDLFRGDLLSDVKVSRYVQPAENVGPTMTKFRFLSAERRLPNAGWHFSYLGGIDAIEKKLSAFAHTEFGAVPKERIEERVRAGRDLFGRAGSFFGVPVDASFPSYVRDHQEPFRHLIFPVDGPYLRRTRFRRLEAAVRGRLYRTMVRLVPGRLALPLVRLRDRLMKRLGRI